VTYRLEEYASHQISKKIKRYIHLFSKALAGMTALISPAKIFSKIPLIAVGILGLFLVSQNIIGTQAFILSFVFLATTGEDIRFLDDFVVNMPELLSFAKRIFAIWDAPQAGAQDAKFQEEESSYAIELSGVTFAYAKEDRCALEELSLAIAPGQKVAIVGESGSGKSTLLKLISRRYLVDQGIIRVFGKDISSWDPSTVSQHMGYVSHESYFWPGTATQCLTMASVQTKEAELNSVAQMMQVSQVLSQRDVGPAMPIENINETFSGGEKQKLALARAMLKDCPIVLFDEATNAIDAEDAQKIIQSLLQEYPNRTMVFATHQFACLEMMDQIYVMENSRIMEQGTHTELMSRSGVYSSMAKAHERGAL
jgi:ABC-type bacteriocin/lantibiotic exporter with double-glycine peptidase domain